MAIKFEIHEVPEPKYNSELLSEEEIIRSAENVKRANAKLKKAMKRIARKEAEVWIKARYMIRR